MRKQFSENIGDRFKTFENLNRRRWCSEQDLELSCDKKYFKQADKAGKEIIVNWLEEN